MVRETVVMEQQRVKVKEKKQRVGHPRGVAAQDHLPPTPLTKEDFRSQTRMRDVVTGTAAISTTSRRRWTSCCVTMDQDAAKFFALLGLTVFILSFSFHQLSVGKACNHAPLWGLIGTMIGFWFEGPRLNNKN